MLLISCIDEYDDHHIQDVPALPALNRYSNLELNHG